LLVTNLPALLKIAGGLSMIGH